MAQRVKCSLSVCEDGMITPENVLRLSAYYSNTAHTRSSSIAAAQDQARAHPWMNVYVAGINRGV